MKSEYTQHLQCAYHIRKVWECFYERWRWWQKQHLSEIYSHFHSPHFSAHAYTNIIANGLVPFRAFTALFTCSMNIVQCVTSPSSLLLSIRCQCISFMFCHRLICFFFNFISIVWQQFNKRGSVYAKTRENIYDLVVHGLLSETNMLSCFQFISQVFMEIRCHQMPIFCIAFYYFRFGVVSVYRINFYSADFRRSSMLFFSTLKFHLMSHKFLANTMCLWRCQEPEP